GVLHAHQLALLNADAVLAGEAPAELDAKLEYLRPAQLGTLKLSLVVGVVQDERMQIAIAGVEDIDHAKPMAAADLGDLGQRLRQLGERDHPVHAVIVRNLSDGTKSRFSPFPDRHALFWALARAHHARAVALGDVGDSIEQAVDLLV